MNRHYRLRTIQLPGDYAPIADILNLIEPGSASAEGLAAEDQHIPAKVNLYRDDNGLLAGFGRDRVVAADGSGRVIGYGAVWRAPWAEPGGLASLFAVHPDFRRQGVGSSLIGHLEGWARQQGASVLNSELKDWIPESLPFAEKRGFVKDAHVFELILELAQFDSNQFAGRETAGGVRFLTLADAPGEESERKLYDLFLETLKDNPGHRGEHAVHHG
jgi:GNAT superfamily N-acetyltransferase